MSNQDWTTNRLTQREAEQVLERAGISLDTSTWDSDIVAKAALVLDVAQYRKQDRNKVLLHQ